MGEKEKYNFIPLKEPVTITEQKWPEGTVPLVHTRTMTYMHEKFIRDCIEGILMQKTTFPVQVLIHDFVVSTIATYIFLRVTLLPKHHKLHKTVFHECIY